MPRVYVIDALKPRGGTYMAYHVGLILQQQFGYEMVAAHTQSQNQPPQFAYEFIPPVLSLEEAEKKIGSDDLLVVNPSFSSLMLGLKLPGRKICYVQDFRTFSILDGHFDLYVSVSTTVKRFMRAVYQLDTPVVPAFIELKKLPAVIPWRERPQNSCMVYTKAGDENRAAAQYVLEEIKARLPQLELRMFSNNGVPHEEFLRQLGSVRYLVNISLAEGFGLIPLEAMALGTCVTGFDGISGQDYMRFEKNSMTRRFNEADHVASTLESMVGNEASMEAISLEAIRTARVFNKKRFRESWSSILAQFLG